MTPDLNPYLFNKDDAEDRPSGRPYEQRVYVVDTAVGPRAMAVTGQAMVACRAKAADVTPTDEHLRLECINAWLTRACPFVESVTRDHLVACLGEEDPPSPPPAEEECSECWGDGTHECECGDEHDCVRCDGSGVRVVRQPAPPAKIRLVSVGGVALNAALVRRYLPLMTEPSVALHWFEHDREPVRFECGDTTLLVMPMSGLSLAEAVTIAIAPSMEQTA